MDLSDSAPFLIIYALIFFCSMGVLIFRSTTKPEQTWYKARALAESIKTSSWRYVMCAEPFGLDQNSLRTRQEFRDQLGAILRANETIGYEFGAVPSEDEQATAEMERLRNEPVADKKDLYLNNRVIDQKTWYSNKAELNKNKARLWTAIGCLIYFLAAISVLLRLNFPHWKFWPTEPLIVMASTTVGWVQIKKFRELATSYKLTALEISIIEEKLREIEDSGALAAFVAEAEQGFSREHTQWLARQAG